VLLLSVAPEVKKISPSRGELPELFGLLPSAVSSVFFALPITSLDRIPILWSELAFPKRSSAASATALQASLQGFVVAALSK
jgi:hypothetical protein